MEPVQQESVTAQDCINAGIPHGYSTKNWDPDERPIILLGSVFDANSLGKWIFDWAVFRDAPDMSLDIAGNLWLALIRLARKMHTAEQQLLRRNVTATKVKLIHDFLDEGDGLWKRLECLLRRCEGSMMRMAVRDQHTIQVVGLDELAGCEFVDCLLGEGRQLDATDDLIHSIMSWCKRFDATFSKKSRTQPTT